MGSWVVGAIRNGLKAGVLLPLLGGAMLFPTSSSFAQGAPDPNVDSSPLSLDPLIGEQFCVDSAFTNQGTAPGFGPYLLVVLDPGMTDAQVAFVDVPPNIEFVGQIDSSGNFTDPVSGQTISGSPGSSVYIGRYPIGSVDNGDPNLVMTACGKLLPTVDIGVPLNVTIIPGFEFGDTATGENGAVLDPGETTNVVITPQLARVEKRNTAPENERPPGPNHPFDYVWTVDVSDQVTLDNVTLTDILPAEIQWTGDPLTITAPQGIGCTDTSSLNLPDMPGGTASISCTSVTGTAGTADLVVTVPAYVSDILSKTTVNSQQTITNTVDLQYEFDAQAYNNDDTSNILALNAAIQKNVSGGDLPGETLTYTVDFQVTDYILGADSFTIQDVLPDGLMFTGTVSLLIDGATVAISESQSDNTPGPGQTTLSWDITAANGGAIPAGADGTLVYRAEVLDAYDDTTPVSAGDVLNNSAGVDYSLGDGGSGDNASSVDVTIRPNTPSKRLADPPPGTEIMPGQAVTFRLAMDIPAGNTRQVELVDFLPRPVFDVATLPPTAVIPNEPGVYQPPGGLPPLVTDNATNSVSMDFGDIDLNQPTRVVVDLTATVTDAPFADNLFLTNLLSASYANSGGTVTSTIKADVVLVGAPKLVITKGVIDAGNPDALLDPDLGGSPDPATQLIDSDANGVDAGDTVEFVITVENLGGQRAYDVLVRDPAIAGLNCNATPLSVTDGTGANLVYTGDLQAGLQLTDPLAGNDDNPDGGGAPYGADTALIRLGCDLDAVVEPRQQIVNTASVTWTAVPGAPTPFPAREDAATLTVAEPELSKSVVQVAPGYSGSLNTAHIGELVTYSLEIAVTEGVTGSAVLTDTLDAGLAFVDVESIVASAGLSSDQGSFTDIASAATITASGGGGTGPDRVLTLDFGALTNADTDNATDEVITVRYRARVLNAATNVSGKGLRNSARFAWVDAAAQSYGVQTRAAPVTVIEPQLQVTKTISPGDGDTQSTPTVTITLSHAGASNAEAFDIDFEDIMPAAGATVLMEIVGLDSATGTCPALTVNPDAVSGTLANLPLGESCTIVLNTEINDLTPAGVSLNNCANLTWQSLSAPDQGALDAPPNNTLGVERTGDGAAAGELNDYLAQDCATFKLYDVGIVKTLNSTSQAYTDNIPGTPQEAESLAIGEEVTFDLVVTVPETTVAELQVQDLLPSTQMTLEMLSATHIANGSAIYPFPGGSAGDPLVPTIGAPNDTSGDGINDAITLDYGNVAHDVDGTTDDADRIHIQVTARVLDVPENQNGDLDDNTAVVSYTTTLGGTRRSQSDTYGIEIVESLLRVEKTANVTEAEAGDAIDYNLRITHSPASRIDAKDLTLSDVLPTELNLVPGSTVTGQCDVAPDTLAENVPGNAINGAWATFPLGAVCNISFQAVVDISVLSGASVRNEADIGWTSLEGSGAPDERTYNAADDWIVVATEPGLSKQIVATSSADTPFSVQDPVVPLTIGETVTFFILADMPDGTTRDVTISDQIPDTVRLLVNASRVVSIGGDLTLSGTVGAGDPASCNTSNPAWTESCSWSLGDVVNQPDTRAEPDLADRIVFEVVATVIDDPANSGVPGADDDVANTAILDSPDAQITALALFDIVEPLLAIDKTTENGSKLEIVQPGDLHRFTLVVEHVAQSTVNARTLEISDTLDSDMLWQGNVTSDCPGLATSAPSPGSTGAVTFTFDSLPLDTQRCEIAFDIELAPGAAAAGVFPNTADLSWESAPDTTQPPSRVGSDSSTAELQTINSTTIIKEVVATSLDDTGDGEYAVDQFDLAIGETVEYVIAAYFDAGTTDNVVITDTLQAAGGELEFLSGEVLQVGNQLLLQDGAPSVSIAGNIIELDYGTVENDGDMVIDENDIIVYRLRARVSDVPANVDGNTLNNTVQLDYQGASPVPTDAVDVDVVEPALVLDKTYTDLEDEVATIELVLSNNGTAPAYDLVITDDLDEDQWLAGSVNPVSVPDGFVLSESGDGLMLVTLQRDGGNPLVPSAEQVVFPGESLTAVFTVALKADRDTSVTTLPNSADALASSLPGPRAVERTFTASGSDDLPLPLLALTKNASAANADAGSVITYTVELANTGDAPASDIVVTDDPDDKGEFQAGSVVVSGTAAAATVEQGNAAGDSAIRVTVPTLANGETLTIVYAVAVPLPYPSGILPAGEQRLENQATAESDETGDLLSDGDTGTPNVAEPTVVDITADPVMTVAKDDQRIFAETGQTITYLVTFGNAGNQDASGVVLTETVPDYTTFNAGASSPGWSCSGTAAGSTCSYAVTGGVAGDGGSGTVLFAVDVDANLPEAVREISNEVAIAEDGREFGQPDSTPSTDGDTEVTPFDPVRTGPDLVIDKDDGGITVVPGQVFAYTVGYVNDGDQTATGVVITETVPAYSTFNAGASSPGWSCADNSPPGTTCTFTVGALPPAAPRTTQFGLQVIAPLPAGVELLNNAVTIVDDGSNSPLPQFDNGSDVTPVVAAPDIVVDKQADVRSTRPDSLIVYTIDYRNAGNQDATGVVVREVVPPGTQFSADDSAPITWSCADGDGPGTVCSYAVGFLGAGAGGSLNFALYVVEEPDIERVVNVVEANDDGSNGPDPNPGNNVDTEVTPFPSKSIPALDVWQLALLALGLFALGLWYYPGGFRPRRGTR